ncbi:Cupredoxin [Kockiozyma suomiensis]|uniref:Cupredoxin n=1 Tax=Kockiozyma suomiensis TaxID=1337062 RepID=UPI0033440F83
MVFRSRSLKTKVLVYLILLLSIASLGFLFSATHTISDSKHQPDTSCNSACHVNDNSELASLVNAQIPTTREYNFIISRVLSSNPDGAVKSHIQVNNLMPGPTIRAHRGDTLVVHVNNNLNESTSIHFHGIRHYGTNSMDGVPGVTQCGIPPGHSFTYKFDLEQSGTFWWHSHSFSQRIDGMAGAMIVYDSNNDQYQFGRDYDDEAIVFIQDYYHQTGEQRLAYYLSRSAAGYEPVPENGLINGRGSENICPRIRSTADCDKQSDIRPYKFTMVRGKRYRLRIINAAAFAEFVFSLDSHLLTVIESDTNESEPLDVHYIPIATGQRYSAIITASNTSPSTVTMRAEMNTNCFNYHNPILDPEVRARVSLIDAKQPASFSSRVKRFLQPSNELSASLSWDDVLIPEQCIDLDPDQLKPVAGGLYAEKRVPEMTERIEIHTKTLKLERVNLAPFGFINRTSFKPAIGAPNLHVQLGFVNAARDTLAIPTVGGRMNTPVWGGDQLIAQVEMSKNRNSPTVIELVIHNPDESAHPFHLHGHDMYLLRTHSARAGLGPWKPKYIDSYRTENVLPRDTITVPRLGHAVVRFIADNPGFWAFHCHIMWHLRTGMMMQFAIGVDQLDRSIVTEEMLEQCKIERNFGERLLEELPGNEFREGMIPA